MVTGGFEKKLRSVEGRELEARGRRRSEGPPARALMDASPLAEFAADGLPGEFGVGSFCSVFCGAGV